IADAAVVVSGPAGAGRQDRTGAILQEHVRADARLVFQRGRYYVVSAGAERVVIVPGAGRCELDIIDVPALEVIEDAVHRVEGEADQHSLSGECRQTERGVTPGAAQGQLSDGCAAGDRGKGRAAVVADLHRGHVEIRIISFRLQDVVERQADAGVVR